MKEREHDEKKRKRKRNEEIRNRKQKTEKNVMSNEIKSDEFISISKFHFNLHIDHSYVLCEYEKVAFYIIKVEWDGR